MDSSGKVRKHKNAVPFYKTVAQLSQRKRKRIDYFNDDGDESMAMLLPEETPSKDLSGNEIENGTGICQV